MKAIHQDKSIWKFFGCILIVSAILCSLIPVPAIPAFIISCMALVSAGMLLLSADPASQYKAAASPIVVESNRRTWISFLRPSKNAGKQIIQDFFIRDNISFQLFTANAAENETIDLLPVISQQEDLATVLNVIDNKEQADCTNTFKKYYAENRLNRISFLPDWLYIAYPDVVHWYEINKEKMEHLLHLTADLKESNAKLGAYRLLIDFYKKNAVQLECQA